jgi:hypothetical protein
MIMETILNFCNFILTDYPIAGWFILLGCLIIGVLFLGGALTLVFWILRLICNVFHGLYGMIRYGY